MINPEAIRLIDRVLHPLLNAGSNINNLKLHVSNTSQLATQASITTTFGELEIAPSNYIAKGTAYIRGNLDHTPVEFAWVSKLTVKEEKP